MQPSDTSMRSINDHAWRFKTATISDKWLESPDVYTYALRLNNSDYDTAYQFQAGQFNMLYVPGVGESAISIAGRSSDGNRLLHTIRAVGNVTRTIARMQVGDTLGIRGPFGIGWPMNCKVAGPPRELVIVAGGIGLAPLRSAIDEAVARPDVWRRIHVLIGARTPQDLVFQAEYEHWRAVGTQISITVDRADDTWHGDVGVVTLLVERLELEDPATAVLMTCGPEVMMRYVAQTAVQRGMCENNVWVTLERNMSCAIGHCGRCQLGPTFVCHDGPVFRYDRVKRWLRVEGL